MKAASPNIGFVAAVAVLTVSCAAQPDACFDPQSVVRGTNVVGVRADPPEQTWRPGLADPEARLRVLIAEQRPALSSVDAQVAVRLCVPDPAVLQCAGEPVSTSHLALDAIDVRVRVPGSLIEQAVEADSLQGYAGTRVLADLSITTATQSLHAAKLLIFSDGVEPNHGLDIDAIELTGQARTPQTLSSGDRIVAVLHDGAIPKAQQRDVLELRPILHPGSVEEYETTDLAGHRLKLREQVTYSLYANDGLFFGDPTDLDTNGGFHFAEHGELADEPESPPEHGLVRLRALSYNHHGRVWFVARDGRGGEAWAWLDVDAHDERCCCAMNSDSNTAGSYPHCCPYQAGDLGPDVSGCANPQQPLCQQPPPFICTRAPCIPPP